MAVMSSGEGVEVTALAINVMIPESQRWTGTRRGERFSLTTLNVRLLPDGHLAVKAYAARRAAAAATMSRSRSPTTPSWRASSAMPRYVPDPCGLLIEASADRCLTGTN